MVWQVADVVWLSFSSGGKFGGKLGATAGNLSYRNGTLGEFPASGRGGLFSLATFPFFTRTKDDSGGGGGGLFSFRIFGEKVDSLEPRFFAFSFAFNIAFSFALSLAFSSAVSSGLRVIDFFRFF